MASRSSRKSIRSNAERKALLPSERKVLSNMEKLENSDQTSVLESMRAAFRIVVPFFCGKDTFVKAFLILCGMMVGVSIWAYATYRVGLDIAALGNSLAARQKDAYEQARLGFFISYLILLPGPSIQVGFAQAFGIEWRRYTSTWLFERYISEKQVYYQLKSQDNTLDNPDQRMSQDVGEFCSSTMRLVEGFATAIVQGSSLAWQLFAIDPTLFLIVVVGAGGLTIFMIFVLGTPLMKLNRLVLAQEAYLRFELVRVREHAEPIAFYQGSDYELTRVNGTFGTTVWFHYRRLVVFTFFLVFQHVCRVYPGLLPHFLVGPSIMIGAAPIGLLGQLQYLFTMLFQQIIVIARDLNVIALCGAQAIRVDQVKKVIGWMDDGKDVNGVPIVSQIKLSEYQDRTDKGGLLQLEAVTLKPPNFPTPTVSGLQMVLLPGESCLLAGASGIGKSSLLRAIAGLWAAGDGHISRVHMDYCFFVPQEPYMSVGTLRENIKYPNVETNPTEESTKEIFDALETVNLKHIGERQGLDKPVDLAAMLSGGEKQRLSFARVLVQKTLKLAILDESTSALDIKNESRMYGLMVERIQSHVSVGHRDNLYRFHTHRLFLEKVDGPGGAKGTYTELPKTDFNSKDRA